MTPLNIAILMIGFVLGLQIHNIQVTIQLRKELEKIKKELFTMKFKEEDDGK